MLRPLLSEYKKEKRECREIRECNSYAKAATTHVQVTSLSTAPEQYLQITISFDCCFSLVSTCYTVCVRFRWRVRSFVRSLFRSALSYDLLRPNSFPSPPLGFFFTSCFGSSGACSALAMSPFSSKVSAFAPLRKS